MGREDSNLRMAGRNPRIAGRPSLRFERSAGRTLGIASQRPRRRLPFASRARLRCAIGPMCAATICRSCSMGSAEAEVSIPRSVSTVSVETAGNRVTVAAVAIDGLISLMRDHLTRDVGDPRAAARNAAAAAAARAPAAAATCRGSPSRSGCAAIAGSGRRGSDLRTLCG
jgi:hypothetical protein